MSGPNWEGNFSATLRKCSHGVFNASGRANNPECSVCVGSIATTGLTKREVMAEAMRTADSRIKAILKVKEEEPENVEQAPDVEEETPAEGIETEAETEVEEVTE